jgi:DNA-binding NtrC family response regulator
VSVVPPRRADTHRHCVLIVDDQRDTSEGLQLLLELQGYDQVRVAAIGTQALAFLQADYAPCVILLDMIMPGMDGAHFLAAKAADPALAAIPVIAVSGSGDTAPAGAAVSMLKPVDFDRLLALVAKHCANALGAS